MQKRKKLLLIFPIAVCAMLLVLGCASCRTKEKKHNWAWDNDADGHWQYCVDENCDEKTEKVPHVDANGDKICDDCNASLKKEDPPAPVEKTETAIIYFHKPADFGNKVYAHAYYHDSDSNTDKNLTGEEKTYEVTTVEDGWYKIEVKHPEGLLKTGSFSLKLSPAEGTSINLTINKSEMWVSAKGNLFATKAEALKDEEPVVVEKNEYTIYMYAPDTEAVAASVLDLDKASLESVADHDNWFSFTFKTDKEITDGFNLSFYLDDATTAVSRNTNKKENIYFISVGDGTAYTSFELAEAAYEQITHPEVKVTVTIHVHKVAEWEDIYGHAYVTADDVLSGPFGSLKGTLDPDNEGWYTFAIEVGESVVALDGSGFTLMVYDERPGSAREELKIEGIKSDCWVAYDGTAYETKEAAEEYELTLIPVVKVEYTIFYYAPAWAEGEAVYVYTFEGPSVGGYHTEMLADGETGWYKVTFKTAEEFSGFGIIFHTNDEDVIKHEFNVTLTDELLEGKAFYFISNDDAIFSNKQAAEAQYEENNKVEYTIYMYAPAAEAVAATGLDFDKTSLESVADHEGWYSLTFKTAKDISDGFNLSFYLDEDETELSRSTNSKDKIYFIAVGEEAGYTSFELAEAAYEKITEVKVTITIHVHKVAEWEDIYGHAYVTADDVLSGPFGSLKGTLDPDNEGWYTFAIEVGESVVALDGSGFTLMVYDERPGSAREELKIEGIKSDCWVAYDGTAYETKEAAEEYELTLIPVVKVEYTIFYYAPAWAEGEAVYVYTFEGPSVGGYHTEMLADGETGWYKVTFKTAEEFSGFGIIFHTNDEDVIKHEFNVTLTEELLEGKAFYFIDNDDAIFGNKQDAEAQYEEIVNLNEKVTVTIHVHKRENWEELYGHAYTASEDLTGEFGSNMGVLDTENEGWYTFVVEIARKEILADADGFTLMLFDMIDKAGREEYKIEGIKSDCWITYDGNVFETKELAEEYEITAQPPIVTPEYAIYYYAPAWPTGEIVYVYTYSGVEVGGYDTVMPAEEDANGWYKITFKNAEEFNSFGIIFHTEDEKIIKHEIKGVALSEELLEGKAFYFIDNGDGVYLNKEAAIAAYEEYLQPASVTIHVHKVAEWENLYGHAYTDSGVLTGGFGSTVGVLDSENEGWYTFVIQVSKGVIAEDGTGFTLMIFDIIPEAGRNELKINKIKNECWVTFDGHSFETKELAEAYDHVHTYDDTYLYEQDGVADTAYHWQICTTCGEESAKMPHEYNSTSNVCIKCGYEKPLADHDHVWSEEYDTSVDGFHTQHCTFVGCSETNPQPHEYGDWVIDSEGVYEGEQGSRHRNCTVCGAREDNSFDALPVLYLRGDINGWGTGDAWKLVADYDAGTLTITGVVFDTVDKGWKLADESWGVQANYWNLDDASKAYFGVNSDGNAMVNVTGTYNIVLNIHDGWKLSVIKTA